MRDIRKKKNLLLTAALVVLVICLMAAFLLSDGLESHDEGSSFAIHMTEIMGSNSAYPGPDGQYYDWVELHNSADAAIDISGYHLTDNDRAVKYTVPGGTILPADGYYVVWCDADAPAGADLAGFSISRDGGEVLYLMNTKNVVVDTAYTVSMERNQPMVFSAGGWSLGSFATPGFANNAAGYEAYRNSRSADSFPVELSEIVASNRLYPAPDGGYYDFIELHNTGADPVDLSGCRLSDTDGEAKFTLPDDLALPPDGYYVVWCGGETGANFSLSRDGGEVVCLQSPSGELLDRVELPALGQNEAYVRRAQEAWQIETRATPGYSNDDSGYARYVASFGLDDCGLVLSEIMTNNRGCLCDGDGDFSDWAELYNGGSAAVDLTGWYLTDDPSEPQKWAFPAMTLEPGEYLLVFCDGKDRTGAELHTNFSLSASGESLCLVTPIGSAADQVELPALSADRAILRNDDGGFSVTDAPTPGYPNTDEGRKALRKARTHGALVINEAMTANDRYLAQSVGEYPDWAELKNTSDAPVSLSGWSLTDRSDDKQKYLLPDVTLQPGETYLILFSTEKMGYTAYPVAPFSLSAEEDWLLLYDPEGGLSDYIHLYQIPYGGSMGRNDEGQCYFSEPTPGWENSGGEPGISAAPTASVAPGIYDGTGPLTVALSAPGEIYYTLDGSLPTTASAHYEAPLTLNSTTVLRAVCVEEGCLPGDVVSMSYIINEGHTLPVLSLTADYGDIFGGNGIYVNYYKDWEVYANLSYYDQSGGSFSIDCGLKLYGSMSRQTNAKKNFKVVFRPRYGQKTLEYDLFDDCDVTSFSSLVLRAGQDYPLALMREELMTSLADDASDSVLTQHFRYCVLYINGQYFGIYCLKEAYSPEYYAAHHNVSPESVTVLRVINVAASDANLYPLMCYAQSHDLTQQEKFDYIADNVDLESLADWVILQAYSGNSDILNNVRYLMSTEDDGKWRYAFYDQDWTFLTHGNITRTALNSETQYGMIPRAVLKNKDYQDYFLKRLAYQLENTLSDENVLARIDELQEILRPEMERERARWGGSVSSWEYSVDKLRAFVTDRSRSRELIDDFSLYFGLTEAEKEAYFGGLLP